MSDMPTEKYPGVLALVWLYSLSPSQFWMLKTTAALQKEVSTYVSRVYSLSLSLPPFYYLKRSCWAEALRNHSRLWASLNRRLGSRLDGGGRGIIPSYVAVAHEYCGHRESLGHGRRHIGAVALGHGLLVWNDCGGKLAVSFAIAIAASGVWDLGRGGSLPRSGRRTSFLDAIFAC